MDLKKALVLRKAKYLRRTGSPGHYKYVYYMPSGRKHHLPKDWKKRSSLDKIRQYPIEGTERPKSPKDAPDGTATFWNPKTGGLLFHGTSVSNDIEYLKGDKDGVVYLTNDYKEAVGYAKGIHLGGSSGGDPRVLYVDVSSGKMIDIDEEIQEEVSEGTGDFGPIFDKARKAGADFAKYTHPSNAYPDREQKVIVALNPGDQLGPNRNGWDIGKNKKWRRDFKR